MVQRIQIKVVDTPIGGLKSNRSSRAVVASVQQGDAIPRGDVGAYLVGVFACQSLTADGRRYDLGVKGQWRHCLYKTQWTAALQGRDEFTEEQQALILAGAVLLRTYSHGWGSEAVAQAHVRKLLERWGAPVQGLGDARNDLVSR